MLNQICRLTNKNGLCWLNLILLPHLNFYITCCPFSKYTYTHYTPNAHAPSRQLGGLGTPRRRSTRDRPNYHSHPH